LSITLGIAEFLDFVLRPYSLFLEHPPMEKVHHPVITSDYFKFNNTILKYRSNLEHCTLRKED
jgi:hypothetical protein